MTLQVVQVTLPSNSLSEFQHLSVLTLWDFKSPRHHAVRVVKWEVFSALQRHTLPRIESNSKGRWGGRVEGYHWWFVIGIRKRMPAYFMALCVKLSFRGGFSRCSTVSCRARNPWSNMRMSKRVFCAHFSLWSAADQRIKHFVWMCVCALSGWTLVAPWNSLLAGILSGFLWVHTSPGTTHTSLKVYIVQMGRGTGKGAGGGGQRESSASVQ